MERQASRGGGVAGSAGATMGDPNPTGVESSPRSAPPRLGRGEAVDRYVMLYELGSGGMGVVYAAYDPELDRKVAVKLLHADGASARSRRRLLREAKAIARLSHPNVVTVHDVGTYGGQVFVAMEFVDGITLRQWLHQGNRGAREVVATLARAGEGLAAAHAADLVHRDFKPDNVLVDRSGRVVVLDFGLARKAGSEDGPLEGSAVADAAEVVDAGDALDASLTRTGARLGTPAYMAPEQHVGAPTDARCDQFSFCVVLWEALYGSRPFDPNSKLTTAMQVVIGAVAEPPKRADVAGHVRRLLARGLAGAPNHRYPSMRVLLDDLSRDPWHRRPRSLVFATLVVGAGISAAMWLAMRDQEYACGGGAERWQGVWDEHRKHRIETAFAASRRAYADTAWRGVERTLDDYAARWIALHREVCEATHVHREQTPDALDLRMACLRGRLDEAGALISELVRADAAVVENAIEAVNELPALRTCLDAASLRSRHALPEDPQVAAAIGRERKRLVDAMAKEFAGRYGPAELIAQDVVEAAHVLAFVPLEAEAQLRLGSVLERRGEFAAAEASLLAAIFAAEASDHLEVAAQAWVRLVWVTGVERLDLVKGHLWSRFAEAAVARMGTPDDLQAALVHNIAGLLYREGRYDAALEQYRQALRLQQRVLGAEDPAVAMTLNHIGNVLMEQHEYVASQEYCERSLELRRRVLGERHPKVAASLNNLAELTRKQGDTVKSFAYAEASLEIVGDAGGPEEAIALVLAADAALALSRGVEAVEHARRLMELVESGAVPGAIALVGAMRRLGEAHLMLGHHEAALEALARAVEIPVPNPSEDAARSWLVLARTHRALGRDRAAVDALDEAEAVSRRLPAADGGLRAAIDRARADLRPHATR